MEKWHDSLQELYMDIMSICTKQTWLFFSLSEINVNTHKMMYRLLNIYWCLTSAKKEKEKKNRNNHNEWQKIHPHIRPQISVNTGFSGPRARKQHITRKNIYNNNNKTGLAHKINVGDHAEKASAKEMKSLRYSQIVHQ